MFVDRDPVIGILYLSAVVPGKKIKDSIVDGDEVTLKIGDEDVLVRDVAATAPGQYSGVIYGFEPSHSIEFNGLRLEGRVEFSKRHIFSCHGA